MPETIDLILAKRDGRRLADDDISWLIAAYARGDVPDEQMSALHASGSGTLVAVSVVAGDGRPLMPCGRCRQLLLEAGGPGLLVDTPGGPQHLGSLLPAAFDAGELAARRPGASAGPAASAGPSASAGTSE